MLVATIALKSTVLLHREDHSLIIANLPPLLRLPTELLLQIAEILLEVGECHLSRMSLTCRSLFHPAISVLYNALFFEPVVLSPTSASKWADKPNRPKYISAKNGALVKKLTISFLSFAREWKFISVLQGWESTQAAYSVLNRCRNLRVLHLVEGNIGELYASQISRNGLNFMSGWKPKDSPLSTVTELIISSPVLTFRGEKAAALRFFPSLRILELDWPENSVIHSIDNFSPSVYTDNGVDFRYLILDINALGAHCRYLEKWKLPLWEPAFSNRNVCVALSKLPSLRQLSFDRQWSRTVKPVYHNLEDYAGFRLYLQNHTRISVIDHESMTYLSMKTLLQISQRSAEMILDYLYDRLSSNYVLQLSMTTTDFCIASSRILNQYPVIDQQDFRLPNRINLLLFGNPPPSIIPLPRLFSSLTLSITHLTTFQHWLPNLHEIVASPCLRAVSLQFFHGESLDFPLCTEPPDGSSDSEKRFEMCRWKRPIAAPKGFEAVHHHHQWRYFGSNTANCNHDENLEIYGSAFAMNATWYEWPDDEGELDIMEKYGINMLYAVPFEKYLIELADSAAYVAFHLDVQIINLSETQ